MLCLWEPWAHRLPAAACPRAVQVLPIMFDVGTNNDSLKADPLCVFSPGPPPPCPLLPSPPSAPPSPAPSLGLPLIFVKHFIVWKIIQTPGLGCQGSPFRALPLLVRAVCVLFACEGRPGAQEREAGWRREYVSLVDELDGGCLHALAQSHRPGVPPPSPRPQGHRPVAHPLPPPGHRMLSLNPQLVLCHCAMAQFARCEP